MAKLKAPLLSLGASGALGRAIVYFPWKGLDCAREYVVPTNPKSDAQQAQRTILTNAVEIIHAAQALETNYLSSYDQTALALYGSIFPTPRTWFNTACKIYIDQTIAEKSAMFLCQGEIDTETPLEITLSGKFYPNGTSDGKVHYGLTKTSMPHSVECNVTAGTFTCPAITTVKGTKYFLQWRAATGSDYEGMRSGIYTAIST